MPTSKVNIDSALNNVVTIIVQNAGDQSVLGGLKCSDGGGLRRLHVRWMRAAGAQGRLGCSMP
jgi:hypothetical protein